MSTRSLDEILPTDCWKHKQGASLQKNILFCFGSVVVHLLFPYTLHFTYPEVVGTLGAPLPTNAIQSTRLIRITILAITTIINLL